MLRKAVLARLKLLFKDLETREIRNIARVFYQTDMHNWEKFGRKAHLKELEKRIKNWYYHPENADRIPPVRVKDLRVEVCKDLEPRGEYIKLRVILSVPGVGVRGEKAFATSPAHIHEDSWVKPRRITS